MTTPAEPPGPEQPEPPADAPVDLGKHPSEHPSAQPGQPGQSAGTLDPNDPYRFGLPDVPPPPEYAPPGWTPPGGWPSPAPPPAPGQPGAPWAFPPGPPPPMAPPGHPGSGSPPMYPGYPQQAPYPPYPGNPNPPRYPPYPYPPAAGDQQARTRRKAVTALVLGVVSIVMFWTAFFDIVLVIAASAFGAVALSERGSGSSTTRRLAVAGLACAAVGAVAAIAWTVYVVHIINNCGGFNQPNTSELRSCLQRQV